MLWLLYTMRMGYWLWASSISFWIRTAWIFRSGPAPVRGYWSSRRQYIRWWQSQEWWSRHPQSSAGQCDPKIDHRKECRRKADHKRRRWGSDTPTRKAKLTIIGEHCQELSSVVNSWQFLKKIVNYCQLSYGERRDMFFYEEGVIFDLWANPIVAADRDFHDQMEIKKICLDREPLLL